MKILRGILFCLLALILIACTAVFIFFQTFDTDQYLPQITKKASLALGRAVSIGHVGLGLSSRGITLDAGPLVMADDLNFTTQPFVTVDRVRISLDLRSLILQREIHITNILLQSPQIHFIRSQEGHVNIQSIGQIKGAVMAGPVVGEAISQPKTPKLPAINVKTITIQDASISFIDQNRTMPVDIWLTDINVNLNDFSFSKPVPLSFNASLYSNAPNVHAGAVMSLDLSKRSVQLSDLKLGMDLSGLDIERLKGISPQMPDSPFLKGMAGSVQLNMAHAGIDASGALEANGDISITGAVIKHFNIIKALLSHLLGTFGMGGNMDNFFNGPLRDKLGAEDTIIEKAEAKFSLHDKALFIDDSLIQTNILELTAKGSMDQGLNMDMQTMLHLNSDISDALVNEFKGFKFLCDDSGRIAIGASLNGIIPHLKYKPNKDFRKKSKRALIQEGGNILGAFLGGGKI